MYLKEPTSVKSKYVLLAKKVYDPEAWKIFVVMKHVAFIGRALASTDAVSIVPDTAYFPSKEALRELHGSSASSEPSGGAFPPAAPKFVKFEYRPFQILAAERVHLTWRLMVALARHRVKSGGRHRWLPPGQFALLISKAPENKRLGFETQKKPWRS